MTGTYHLITRDAAAALQEFSAEFDSALVVAEATPIWGRDLGLARSSNAILTTYPIPIDAAGYRKLKGELKYRHLFARSCKVTPEPWQDGVDELAVRVEAPDFPGWVQAPANMAREARRHPNILVGTMLEANPLLDLYEYKLEHSTIASTINLFSASHLINIVKPSLGTFDNDIGSGTYSAIDATFTAGMKHYFRTLNGPNNRPLGLEMTHLLVPPARAEEAYDFYKRDQLIEIVQNVAGAENVAAVTNRNRHAGTVEVVVASELTDDDVVYPMALNTGAYPWIIQDAGPPEEILNDKSSDYYKRYLKVSVAYVQHWGVAAALPHGIARVDLG